MLLGCVNVVDCISQAEHRARLAHAAGMPAPAPHEPEPEDNDSGFLLVCTQPRQLRVPFRNSGQHKIYRLPPKSLAMALRGLEASHAEAELALPPVPASSAARPGGMRLVDQREVDLHRPAPPALHSLAAAGSCVTC